MTASVAVTAAVLWRAQLRGKSKHEAAKTIAEAAQLLRYHFYEARRPLLEAWEFPAVYLAVRVHTQDEEANGYQHVYNNRWRELWPQISTVATLRAKAGALLGEDVATTLEKLARKAMELQSYMAHHVKQIRDGSHIVSQWSDQTYVERVKESVVTQLGSTLGTATDAYSQEFETVFAELRGMVEKHL